MAKYDLYAGPLHTPIAEVAHTAAMKKIGSALIMQNSKLVGIFTTTDALLALSEILKMS